MKLMLPIGLQMDSVVVRELQVKGMDGFARKIMTDVKASKNPVKVATSLIGHCIQFNGKAIGDKMAQQMFVVDRNAAIMAIQRESYGDTVSARYSCGWCSEIFTIEDDLSQVQCKTLDDGWMDSVQVFLETGYADGQGDMHRDVTLRIPTGLDEEVTNYLINKNYGEWCTAVLVRLITKFGDLDMDKFAGLGVKVIDSLPVKDIDKMIKAITQDLPGYDLKHDVVCSNCGRSSEQTLDMSGFFIPA